MFSRPATNALRGGLSSRTGATRCLSSISQAGRRPQMHSHARTSHNQNWQQSRGKASFTRGAKELWAAHPYLVSLAAATILAGSAGIAYANYLYSTYIIASFHNYPEPVAQKLRRAIYYTNIDLDPKNALKYYKQGLEIANELGMDPFSNEIIGVKIQVSALMEKIQNYPKAIQVLEILRNDCLAWEEKFGRLEDHKEKRTRIMKQLVALSVKLGDLYSNQYIQDGKAAEERLVWALETSLREKQRRREPGVLEKEGEWMSDNEMGASMEALAHNYEDQNKHYLAVPLFLQALNFKSDKDCHSVILMNNLAISIAQQNPPPSSETKPPSQAVLVENAKQWAQKALDLAADIQPPARDEECDVGCAVALHNLGEFAEMNKDIIEAKKRYKEAVSLARAIGFEDGLENSSAALRRLS
ncbi:hypothetical protein E4T38_05169 [Aureobasidium subglaciale]|nr:hypothetical protein E4T38_05169 [Aureobasidium subglaciale]KAI5222030.1 hypothetical protein E4T40_05207 [Aureobasidium subglaciale]KAI5225917.1 hypothetical protein E4T41_05026 [Aureobasidium subglaciale]KAI5261861.1 hypothetical protein E4T46_04919 [Aureobasidium subglaciale]